MRYEVCYIYHKDTCMVVLSVLCLWALLDIYSVCNPGREKADVDVWREEYDGWTLFPSDLFRG